MNKQQDNLENIEELTVKLNKVLQNIDARRLASSF